MGKILILLIKIYQKTLSPDRGFLKILFPRGVCKYYPTCSEYWVLAIKKHGALKGVLMGCWRIVRCNPFSKGGEDTP